MKRTPLFRGLRRSLSAVGALLLVPASWLPAANRFWVNASGGNFGSSANWSSSPGGPSGASAPVAADNANFTLNNTYTVELFSSVTNTFVIVENGNVTLDLNSSNYTLSSFDSIMAGFTPGQTGRLTVREGIMGVSTQGNDVLIGNLAGSTGFLTVTTGATLGAVGARPNVTVGPAGTGTLTVNETGRANIFTLLIGDLTGASGTMTVTGANAAADVSSTLTAGRSGSGTLSVLNGGTLTCAGTASVGLNAGVDGSATVSGAGSSWTVASDAIIGSAGDGTLTVSAGGALISGSVTLAQFSTGVGTATVTGAGSQWRQTSTALIGSAGLGVMNVSSGGHVESAGAGAVGNNAGSEGRVTVSGAGSQWLLSNPLTIGQAGAGELTVSAGGEVAATGLTIANTATGTGEVTITGAGSSLTTTTTVNVGAGGNGTLSVLSGGTLRTGGGMTINDPAGAPVGTLTIDGGNVYAGGNFTNNGIFRFDDGLLQVTGNFQLAATPVAFFLDGFDADDLPVLDLIGGGTTTNVTSLVVANGRRAKMMLRFSRVMTNTSSVSIGAGITGEGTLSVESGAVLNVPGNILAVGGTPSFAGGTGTLDIAGGTVDAGTLRNYIAGTVNLSSGLLAVDTMAVMDGAFHWTGGTLRFDAATILTNVNTPKFLGAVPALHTGQSLTSAAGAALTLQTPLVLDGGVLNAGMLINQSRLELRSGSLGGAVQNDGLLLGDGVVSAVLTNNTAGRIRVDEGDTLTFTATPGGNGGQYTLQGGTLEFPGVIINLSTGFISGHGALFTGGIIQNGQMAFSGGNMDIFGDVSLTAGSRVATSGAGSVTTFWDDVTHNGTEIFTGAGCSTVFFGAQTGAGSYTGTGAVYFIGDLRPGNSPAIVTCAPEAVFSPSSGVNLEIGGLTPGTQHDKLVFTSAAATQVTWSGKLTVTLINGFTPAAGQSFDVFDFDAARDSGTFFSINVVDHGLLSPGLAFNFDDLYTTGIIRVVSTTGTTFAQWAAAELGDPGALPGGDHNKNGYDNLTEYALALHPPFPGASEPRGGFHDYPEGERLRVLFWRHIDRTDIIIRVQVSTDLTNWTDLAVSVNSAPFTGAGFVSENRAHPLSEPGLVEVRDILNAGSEARRHLRIFLTLSP